ncbi:2-keto-3-deoxygluconate permease, partial [Turicibacter sanguinis]|nr:2-keto-3-deoxygluconate permease [Turicibacter sanguinis]
LAAVDPTYVLIAPVATAQVAASVIITAFLTPMLTSFVAKQNEKKAQKTV